MNFITEKLILASMQMADPTTPPPKSAEDFQKAAKGATMSFGFITDNPWIWTPLGAICGLLVSAMLAKGLIAGGARIGFAGNKPGAVSAGMSEAKNSLIGTAMVTAAFTLIGSIVTFFANAVK